MTQYIWYVPSILLDRFLQNANVPVYACPHVSARSPVISLSRGRRGLKNDSRRRTRSDSTRCVEFQHTRRYPKTPKTFLRAGRAHAYYTIRRRFFYYCFFFFTRITRKSSDIKSYVVVALIYGTIYRGNMRGLASAVVQPDSTDVRTEILKINRPIHIIDKNTVKYYKNIGRFVSFCSLNRVINQ